MQPLLFQNKEMRQAYVFIYTYLGSYRRMHYADIDIHNLHIYIIISAFYLIIILLLLLLFLLLLFQL